MAWADISVLIFIVEFVLMLKFVLHNQNCHHRIRLFILVQRKALSDANRNSSTNHETENWETSFTHRYGFKFHPFYKLIMQIYLK